MRIFLLVLLLVSCGLVSAESRTVLRSELGAAWPLSVDYGTLGCINRGNVQVATFIAPGGKWYALNGIAMGQGYALIDPIWLDDPEIEGAKKNIRALIDLALALCGR